MTNKGLAALLAGGLVLATASSLWMREVNRVSRHDAMREQLQHLRAQPALQRGTQVPQVTPVRAPAEKPRRWKETGIEHYRELERKAREGMLLNQKPRGR